MDKEKVFYNAAAVAADGNPQAMRAIMKKLAKQYDGMFPGWEVAYEYLANGGTVGRMEARNKNTMPDPKTEWENLEQRGIRLVFSDEKDYPALLREIHDAPLALYVLGELPQTSSITIVGTRRATPDGKAITRKFARELASAKLTVVSGLALGIDAEAHEGCLEGKERTIAVLARGLDRIYPAENEYLAKHILEHGGVIISEYPAAEPPYPDRFLERNRIVSGLSEGVLVVEAPQRSGSLATATFALEQGRNVFVVPGPVSHPNFFGSHQLIRQGAELVTGPDEILEAYGINKKEKVTRTKREEQNATTEEKQVLIALRDANMPLEVDKIIALTKLEPRVVNRAITFLVVRELIKEMDTGYIIE
jgi:DNA processing protein